MTPAFVEPLHVGRPNLGDRGRYYRRLDDAFDRRWLTNDGRFVREFEERVADLCGRKFCVAVASGTAAIAVMLQAAEYGDIVLPAWTFVGTARSLRWWRRSEFVDVDATTQCIDHEGTTRALTRPYRAVLGVHLWGRSCPVHELTRAVKKRRAVLFYDAAHALGCTHEGKSLAAYGDAAALSFHATKIVNSGEGGAIVTDDEGLAQSARQLRNFGYDHTGNLVGTGTNAKLSELHAALGLTNLEALPQFIAHNHANYQAYQRGLAGIAGIALLPHKAGSNYHYVVVQLNGERCPISRDALMVALHAEGVLARRYFWPGCHRLPPYCEHPQPALPVTDRLAQETLVLPTGMAVSEADVARVCELIGEIVEQAAA